VQLQAEVLQEIGTTLFVQNFILFNVTLNFYSYLEKILMGSYDVETVVVTRVFVLFDEKNAARMTEGRELAWWSTCQVDVTEVSDQKLMPSDKGLVLCIR
jgi:hypothetical protein